MTTTTMDTAAPNFGPYHGQFEGHARVSMRLALLEAAALVAFPWIMGVIALVHHPGHLYAHDLPMAPGWLVVVDLLGIVLAWSCYSLYSRLSARISAGAPGFPFLDRIRLTIALLAQNVLALILLIAIMMR